MKSFFRLLHALIAGFAAKLIFEGIYREYTDGLPLMDYENATINKTSSEIVSSIADLWNNAMEQSLITTAISFVLIFVLLEYINIGLIIKSIIQGSRNDLKEIRSSNQ